MKETTFFILVGVLSAVSLTTGIIGWCISKRLDEKYHGKPSTFRDLYEDNEIKFNDVPDFCKSCEHYDPNDFCVCPRLMFAYPKTK